MKKVVILLIICVALMGLCGCESFSPKPDNENVSQGLEYESLGDGTCCVSGIGSCTDTDIVIPSTSPEGDIVTSIGFMAFNCCRGLTSVKIPNSVTSIGDHAFAWCERLASVEIPDSVTSIGYGAFYHCPSLASVVIPDSVTSIDNEAFRGCYSLTSVVIPDSVTSIGDLAFSGCTNIIVNEGNKYYKSIDGNLYTKDEKTLIQYAIGKQDKSFVIPDSVTNIGDNAFLGCDRLTSVVIGDNVTSIGNNAFAWCDRLTSVEIPDSVTSIGDAAFSGCTNITVNEGNKYYKSIDGNLYTKDEKTLIQYAIGKQDKSFVIPDSVTSIGNYAFSNCSSLTSIVIPDSVTSIGEGVFYDCDSLKDIYYTGSEAEWYAITNYDWIENVTIHYDYLH